jgi:hypothetical protein
MAGKLLPEVERLSWTRAEQQLSMAVTLLRRVISTFPIVI